MSSISAKSKLTALVFTMVCAIAMSLALAPAAFAASASSPDVTVTSYHNDTVVYNGDYDQHVKVVVDFGDTVALGTATNPLDGLTITIAGFNVKLDSYYRPPTYTISGNQFIIDIPNRLVSQANPVYQFTAQYNGVLQITGSTGLTAGGTAVSDLNIKTVIPTGTHVVATNSTVGNAVTVKCDHLANVRGMVHTVVYSRTQKVDEETGELVYDGDDPVYEYTPVNTNGSTSGNLGIGTTTSHAHAFMTLTKDQLLANIYSSINGTLPTGYSIQYTAGSDDVDGDDTFTITGPAGTYLLVSVVDDSMFRTLGMTYTGVSNNDGVVSSGYGAHFPGAGGTN